MFAERWKTGLLGTQHDGLETGTDMIARSGDPRHKTQQR
jgi:hypothetical protein